MRENIFQFAAAFAFFLGCTEIPDELRDGGCAGRANAEWQFCAGGQVYDFCDGGPYNPSVVACCNNHQYTKSTEFCLGIAIYPRCGGMEYDPSNDRCSGGIVETRCGTGGSYYNPSTQFCLGSGVYDKCGGREYNPSYERCSGGVVETRCGTGGSYYNPSTQFCSENSVYPLCGGNTYQPLNNGEPYQKCESGVVVTRCGTGNNYHNPSTEFCNGNDVFSKCGGSTYNPPYERCSGGVIETKCGSDWYNSSNPDFRCQNDVLETRCGTGSDYYNPSTHFCHTDNTVHIICGGSSNYNPSTQYCSNGTTVANYVFMENYKTVVIGTQTWMAENLNDSVGGSRCYGDNTGGDSQGNCAKYGRLYDWATAMARPDCGYGTSCGSQINYPHRGICPSGWHIPSDAEWTTLTTYVGGSTTKLKATSGWNAHPRIPTGTDDYGFAALPGGNGYSGGYFDNAGNNGNWWSSTESNTDFAFRRSMFYSNEDVFWYDGNKSTLFSVRCLKD